MYGRTLPYSSQSLWLFAFMALFDMGCSGKDAQTQIPESEDMGYGALCSLMRSASPGEALDAHEVKLVHNPKSPMEPVATPEAMTRDEQKQAEATTKSSKSFQDALSNSQPAMPHVSQAEWLQETARNIEATFSLWTTKVWHNSTQLESNVVSSMMLHSMATLDHAKNLAHGAFLFIRTAGQHYPVMQIALPVLFLVLVGLAFIFPLDSCISRSMRQSPLNPTLAPKGSVRRASPLASPYQSKPHTATASLGQVPPMLTAPHQPSAAAISGLSRMPFSARELQTPPQGSPRASSASHLPGSSCRRLTSVDIPHLCAELVVPEETECNLLVPELPVTSAFSGGSRVSIDDNAGVAVFHAALGFPSSQHSKSGLGSDVRRLTLWSAIDGLAFASCCDAEPVAGQPPALAIFHHSEVPFGELRPASGMGGRGTYSIVTHTGREIFLYTAAEGSCVRAEDESGRLLAMVIGVAPRSIRIGPQVDAGLMTLALLGIDLLEHDARLLERGPRMLPAHV